VTNSFGQTPNNNPMNNAFSQLASPLFPQQPGMDQAMQLLIPQLLVNYALQQQQQADPNNPNQIGNPVVDVLNRLVTAMSVDKNNQQYNSNNTGSLLNPTPFDELLKEENNNKWN
jgi:hypothetical protein